MSDREVVGEVLSIQLCPGRRQSMRRVVQARAHKDFGLEGDSHARTQSKRQVLLIEHETLMELGVSVSAVKENITTRGIGLMKLSPGQRLQLGEVVRLELTVPCEPCSRMDEIRPGLREELDGRRGILAKVVTGGVFSIGDAIRVVSPGMDYNS
jgi:MOSC domain-containing protein YiiM